MAPVKAKPPQLTNAIARSRRRRRISYASALLNAKGTKAVISEGGGEGSLAGQDVVLRGVDSACDHQDYSAR